MTATPLTSLSLSHRPTVSRLPAPARAPIPWVLIATAPGLPTVPAPRSTQPSSPGLGPWPGLAPRGSEKWGAGSQMTARLARPQETAGGPQRQITVQFSFLPNLRPRTLDSVSGFWAFAQTQYRLAHIIFF